MSQLTPDEKQILMDSPEAAQLKTVTGWVSRDGHFFGDDERLARWAGATHKKCEQYGAIVEKSWIICPKCRDARKHEEFLRFPKQEWDGVTPLALHDTDTYFFDYESLEDYAEDTDTKVEDLPLVICFPQHPQELVANELWEDILPEDGEVEDEEILNALEKLNEVVRKAKPFSWLPGKIAAIVKTQEQEKAA